jgi:hypothetical protein
MIENLLKNRKIKKLLFELESAKNLGHIVFITDITDVRVIGGELETIGVEIMFADKIADTTIARLIKYIEHKYKFSTNTELIERGTGPKILIVEY